MIASLESTANESEVRLAGDNENHYEIIDGHRVELAPMSILAGRVASIIHVYLGQHVLANSAGEALTDVLFRLPLPVDRNRRPHVAFVSAKTRAALPNNRDRTMPGT